MLSWTLGLAERASRGAMGRGERIVACGSLHDGAPGSSGLPWILGFLTLPGAWATTLPGDPGSPPIAMAAGVALLPDSGSIRRSGFQAITWRWTSESVPLRGCSSPVSMGSLPGSGHGPPPGLRWLGSVRAGGAVRGADTGGCWCSAGGHAFIFPDVRYASPPTTLHHLPFRPP